MLEQISYALESIGGKRVQLNVPDLILYYLPTDTSKEFILLLDTNNSGQSLSTVRGIMIQISQRIHEQYDNAQCLTIISTCRLMEERCLLDTNERIWFIDRTTGQLVIYEDQQTGFPKVKQAVEAVLDQYWDEREASHYSKKKDIEPMSFKEKMRAFSKTVPICSFVLVMINFLIFIGMDLTCSYAMQEEISDRFGLLWTAVLNGKEYYRFITCMFLHGGISHVFNNMMVLYFVGQVLEKAVSKTKYLSIYFGAGILAGVTSMAYNYYQNEEVVSIGASGAIFGLVGAVLFILLRDREFSKKMNPRQLLLFVIFSLYGGFQSANIDNAAHIGGFVGGILLAAILYRKPKREVY